MSAIWRLTISSVTLMLWSQLAFAMPIVHYFEGHLSGFTLPGAGAIPCAIPVCEGIDGVGSDFHGLFSFDSSAQDIFSDNPDIGRYFSEGFPFGFSMYIDLTATWIFTTGVEVTYSILFPDTPGFNETVAVWSQGTSLTEGVQDFNAISLLFCYPDQTLDDVAPQTIPGIGSGPCHVASFANPQVIVRMNGNGYTGFLTEIRRVPEPGTLALFGIGLAGIGLSRRRRKV